MKRLTRDDLYGIYISHKHFKRGYCCYQDDGLSEHNLINLGYNAATLGWNWTAYLEPITDTVYCSCYRNVPNYLKEK